MTQETRRWDLKIDEKRARTLGYLPEYFNTWASNEARALGHKLIRVKNFAQASKGSKVVLSADVDLDVDARAEEAAARAKEAQRQRELRGAPKITAPMTLQWYWEVDRFEIERIAVYREPNFWEKRYAAQAERMARARQARVVEIKNFKAMAQDDTQSIRMVADLDLEPYDREAEIAKQRELMMMNQTYMGPGILRGLAGATAPDLGPYQVSPQTATEIRAKQQEMEWRYQMSRMSPRIWSDEIAKQYDKASLEAILYGTGLYETKPAAKPKAPEPPPKPVAVVRALDLDEAAEIALPTQKGRVIDLE